MELITSIRKAIYYMEKHLTDNISAQDVADQVYLSPFFLQKGFSLIRLFFPCLSKYRFKEVFKWNTR